MQKIIEKLSGEKKIVKINDNLIEIITDAELASGVDVKILVKKVDDKIYLTDNKNTLRFMNTKYELSAKDVKQCINDIVKHYNFIIEKGEIFTELKPSDNYNRRYNEFLICSCTLANMFIFFDTPASY